MIAEHEDEAQPAGDERRRHRRDAEERARLLQRRHPAAAEDEDAVEHERRGERESGEQMQREHPVVEIHGEKITGSARAELAFDCALELVRLEAERALAALEGDAAVARDQVQAVRPAAVGRGDGVVDPVDAIGMVMRRPTAQVWATSLRSSSVVGSWTDRPERRFSGRIQPSSGCASRM